MARKATGTKYSIDPAHERLDIYGAPTSATIPDCHAITLDVWKSKYRWSEEEHPFDSMQRVTEGVYAKDHDTDAKRDALEAMQKLLWVPAGRIQAGAGTSNIVTLLNCYMCRDIEDSMSGIADALKDTMLTLQQGGGDGMNFSTLRPALANLNRTGAVASGPLPFMDMWDSMCGTIMSAGSRRGAQMGVLDCEHPDLPDFIVAKREKGRWTNFNISVLITDAFMDAVKHDEDWFLGFNVPRKDGKHLFVTEKELDDGSIELWYAYSKWSARKLWDLIVENTFEWSEPGILFIDRINRRNNLSYCEVITGTNPCGEQPLPPNGCCNLGAANLARMVTDPFTKYAKFDYELLREIAALGVRFLDNVIDVTIYPLDEQAKEEFAKRRIGMGITGLANCLAQLGIVYGSKHAIDTTNHIMEVLCCAVYEASALLAKERGAFPLYDEAAWGSTSPIVEKLPERIKSEIAKYGIRNGVLLTIAPTGTTSLYAGNVSSGLEPTFQMKAQRNVRQLDDTFKPYTVYDYGYLLYIAVKGHPPDDAHMPEYMISHEVLGVKEHLLMQAACQQWIDSSVSKTINCPPDITFDEFRDIYSMAYELGLKGCTTYRYSEVRGSILSATGEAAAGPEHKPEVHLVRPDVLQGSTYKLSWPNSEDNYYVTINDVGSKPFEMFIQSTSSKYADWATALSLMISAIMRKGGDTSFISRELMKVKSADDAGWVNQKFYGSLVALIGDTIGKHHKNGESSVVEEVADEVNTNPLRGDVCPSCGQPTLFRIEGCDRCTSCDYSRCG
jgi:ribonucleoside-diphosphate reductase alpha chain